MRCIPGESALFSSSCRFWSCPVSFSSSQALIVASILREAAEAEILPRFRNLSEGQIRQKSSVHDLVTDADEAAEKVIEAQLRSRFPQAVIIGEEASERDPSLLG